MSDNQNRGARDYSKYDSMETEKLEEILRLDAEAPEGQESDTEEILYIMEVLAQRDKESTGKTALKAWNSFQQQYLSDEEAISKATKKARPWLRRMIASAAVIAILVCVPFTVNAFDMGELWDIFVSWAKETFSFVSSNTPDVSAPDAEDNIQYTSLQQALGEAGFEFDYIPTRFPEGYSLSTFTMDEMPGRKTFVAFFSNGERVFKICLQSYLDSDPEKVEFSDDLLEVYSSSQMNYYIFSNQNQYRVSWVKDSYECYISGELTIEDLKSMIDSIRKG